MRCRPARSDAFALVVTHHGEMVLVNVQTEKLFG